MGLMTTPLPARMLFLAGAALLLFGILITRWISHWGLVTIHVKNAPLGKVVASIARQGHIQIETSLDVTKPISLDVDLVTPAEALETLSIGADATWRLVYLAAPTKPALNAALISLKGNGKLEDWTAYYYPMPFGAEITSGMVVDPRYGDLTLEGPDRAFPQLLNQAAQKGGVMTLFPTKWAPTVSQLPKSNQTRKIIPSLVQSVHGKSIEFFFLTERGRRDRTPGEAPPSGEQVQAQPEMNFDWLEQRVLTQITHLPPEKQAEAKKNLQEHKDLLATMRKLSPEERRAKMRALMSDPDRMEKMAERMLIRDSKMSANQRITRAENYLSRKASAQASAPH